MVSLGFAALVAGLAVAIYVALASLIAGMRRYPELGASGRNGIFVLGGLITIASAVMLYALVSRNFQLAYVANYTSRDLSLFYTLAAFYAGQEGSLLLWVWLLSIFTIVTVLLNWNKHRELMPYAIAIIAFTQVFFLVLLVFITNPFQTLPYAPPDGQGLNPLLENPGMISHPPALLGGYVGFTIPFAFALAALITRKLGDEWVRSVRIWTLVAWLLLTIGNLAGMQWAYVELGWGGYMGWDPVENASVMPWLTGTAFLHSVLVQKRRGMLKVWNMVLIISTFVLAIFGTFLTRSGILSSVHSFGQSSLGPFFLGFIGLILLVSFGFLFDRYSDLKSEDELDSFVSRESMFLLNNLLLVAATFAMLWGTVFPLVSEAVRGVKVTVAAPFYNVVVGPILLGVVAVLGFCILIGWGRTTGKKLVGKLIVPGAISLVGVTFLIIFRVGPWYVDFLFALCGLVFLTIVFEWSREVAARRRAKKATYWGSFWTLMRANKPRYGAYIIHIGAALLVIGIVGSSFFNTSKEATLNPGQAMTIRQYTVKYEKLDIYQTESRQIVSTSMSVTNGGEVIGMLVPQKYTHVNHDNPVTEVAIRSTLKEDLYVILIGWEGDVATFKVLVNPLMAWMWIGSVVMILGTVVACLPERRKRLELPVVEEA